MNYSPIFIETIRITEGNIFSLNHHQKRVNKTLTDHALPPLDITKLLYNLPLTIPKPICRCRITYGQIPVQISFLPYTPIVRKRVRIMKNDKISYSYKYANRTQIEEVFRLANSDDVIIVKENMITDSSVANLVFENKEGLFTPATPLLKGTERQRLLDEGIISLRKISLDNLNEYDNIYFINAMMPFGTMPPLSIADLEY